MSQKREIPSRIAMTLFHWFCYEEFREEIEGDLMERFNENVEHHGYKKANRLFIKDVVFLFRPAIMGNLFQLTNTGTMSTIKQNKRLTAIIFAAASILLIPFVAMFFTAEVNWKFGDFLVAGILLLGTAIVLEIILRNIKKLPIRILIISIVFLALLLIWAELAVGIFGTPFAGS